MNHLGTINIETERLLLRRFVETDAKAVFKNWASDPDVTRYLSWPPHDTADVTKKIIDKWIELYDSNERYHWAIVPKDIQRPIGSISVVNQSENDEKCELGYCIGKEYWNKGMTTEAMKGVIDFLFKKIGYNRLQAYHHTDNTASGKVMLKAGMMYEGRMRRAVKNKDGDFVDIDIYAIIKEDLF